MPETRTFVLEELGFEGLRLRTRRIAEPGPHQVLLKMRAASLNFRDLKIVKGTYARAPALPVVLLSDGAGDVVSIGEGVTRFAVGDRAMPIYMSGWHRGSLSDRHAGWKGLGGDIDGTATEFSLIDEEDLVTIPDHLSYEEAACIPCAGVTAWHALVSAGQIKAGDDVLVLGSGGVSLFALQIATMSGARVLAISSSDDKLMRLKDMGASEGVNYMKTPDWDQRVLELTQGRGVDHVVEVVGNQTMLRSIRTTRDEGHISIIGDLGGGLSKEGAPDRGVRLSRITVGSRQMTEDLLRAMKIHKKTPVIDRAFAFNDLKKALLYLESGQHFGKVVISYDDANR